MAAYMKIVFLSALQFLLHGGPGKDAVDVLPGVLLQNGGE